MRRIVIAALFSFAVLRGQNTPARPAFDLASIKPDNILQTLLPYCSAAFREQDHDAQYAARDGHCVCLSYCESFLEVTGNVHLPDGWNFYDIEAIVGGDVSDDILRLMFQSLLEDRFKLKVHRETREMTAYELVVAKGGPKLKRADPDGEVTLDGQPIEKGNSLSAYGADGGMHLVGKSASMERLVYALSGRLRAPVLDRTGLTGPFDYNIVFSREDVPSDTGGPPALVTALEEEMGLRLEKTRSQVGIIVVDHVEKPTGN